MKRTYVGYALLRDQTGLIIPSNTINLTCDNFNINEIFHIPSGSLIGYKQDNYFVYDSSILGNMDVYKYKFIGDDNYYVKASDITDINLQNKLESYTKDNSFVLLDDEISLNDGNLKYYEGVPTYFRDDTFRFMEVRGAVANDLENMMYSDNRKEYILYKDLDVNSINYKKPYYIRFRNNFLKYNTNGPTTNANVRNSSINDFNLVDKDVKIYFKLTDKIAENLEKNITDRNHDPLFIIYTFNSVKKTIVPYNEHDLLDEYVRSSDRLQSLLNKLKSRTVISNEEEFLTPEKNGRVKYIKLANTQIRDGLGITDENSLHIVEMPDGNLYLEFNYKDLRFTENEKVLDFYFYESQDLNVLYTPELKQFLDGNEFKEIPIYNFEGYTNKNGILKNYIISESPVNGRYYKKYENQLDATYMTKKLYMWLNDDEFKSVINSVGGYKDKSNGYEVYTSYDFNPTRNYIRYREDYDKNYNKVVADYEVKQDFHTIKDGDTLNQ